MLAIAGPIGKLLTDFLCGCFIYNNAAVHPNVCLFVCLFIFIIYFALKDPRTINILWLNILTF